LSSAYIAECLGHFEFKTLLLLSSAFCEGQISFYQAIQLTVRAELAQARKLDTGNFTFNKAFFSSHHASSAVSMSSAKIYV
jgi:hypothetical protein